jgi:hypothetical protein
MANWKQVQVRIRKAKASADPQAALTALYGETGDAMVAFELAKLAEKPGQNEEATRWYTAAWEKFRRDEWKKKAAQALERLGAPLPAKSAGPSAPTEQTATLLPVTPEQHLQVAIGEAPAEAPASTPPGEAPAERAAAGGKRRRRGRRGGRGRRKQQPVVQPGAPQEARPRPAPTRPPAPEARPSRRTESQAAEVTEPERPSAGSAWAARSGTGDPGLASRLAFLESRLRRLLACPAHRVDEAELAPAGPGVFLLSDEDQSSYYYVEAGRTLRIALAQVLKPGRGPNLRKKLAEHLGISEPHATKYLKEHCIVRWVQLEDEADRLAHFAIAALRPVLNE